MTTAAATSAAPMPASTSERRRTLASPAAWARKRRRAPALIGGTSSRSRAGRPDRGEKAAELLLPLRLRRRTLRYVEALRQALRRDRGGEVRELLRLQGEQLISGLGGLRPS